MGWEEVVGSGRGCTAVTLVKVQLFPMVLNVHLKP